VVKLFVFVFLSMLLLLLLLPAIPEKKFAVDAGFISLIVVIMNYLQHDQYATNPLVYVGSRLNHSSRERERERER
jgi:hypothetical protein